MIGAAERIGPGRAVVVVAVDLVLSGITPLTPRCNRRRV
jgi:hypothetical protein